MTALLRTTHLRRRTIGGATGSKWIWSVDTLLGRSPRHEPYKPVGQIAGALCYPAEYGRPARGKGWRVNLCPWALSLLLARDLVPVDFDPTHVGVAAVAVAATRHQIRPADFIDLGEVDFIDQASVGGQSDRIEHHPAHF
jgi:hypothetical protein